MIGNDNRHTEKGMKKRYRIYVRSELDVTTVAGFKSVIEAYEYLASMEEAFTDSVRQVEIVAYHK